MLLLYSSQVVDLGILSNQSRLFPAIAHDALYHPPVETVEKA